MLVALDEGPGPPIRYQYAELGKLYSVVSQLVRCCDVSSRMRSSNPVRKFTIYSAFYKTAVSEVHLKFQKCALNFAVSFCSCQSKCELQNEILNFVANLVANLHALMQQKFEATFNKTNYISF